MSRPIPMPRKAETSKIPVPFMRKQEENEGSTILHLAEVHKTNSAVDNESTEDESGNAAQNDGKRRKKVRKRGTFLVRKRSVKESASDSMNKEDEVFKTPAPPARRGSATETLSESSNEGEENRIKLIPLAHRTRLKKPSGYATETLSEASNESPKRVSSAPLPRPRQKLPVPRTLTSPETSVEHLKLNSPASKATPTLQYPKHFSVEDIISNKQPDETDMESIVKSPQPSSKSIKSLSIQADQPLISEHESPLLPRPESKASKGDLIEATDSPMNYYTSSSVDYKDTGVIPHPRVKRSKKKRKIKDDDEISTDNTDKGSSTSLKATEEVQKEADMPDKDTAVCVTIHRCDPLRMKDVLKRPSVRVHLMDVNTKNYRRSAFGKNAVDVVQTFPFDHIQRRSVIPAWEEDLILMEPASHVVAVDCVFIFELIELETEEILAWAFLKPLAANGKHNTGTILRLQLFKPAKSRQSKSDDSSLPMAFLWFLKNKSSTYKSTMLVSVHSIDSNLVVRPEKNVATVNNAKTENRRRSSQMSNVVNMKLSGAEKELIGVVWSRIATLSCKLPNRINASLPAGPDGGMSVSYSNSGLLVACQTSTAITVFTYKGSCYLVLSGHQGLIYDLSWSPDDSFLLSSSADTTTCVWNIKLKLSAPVAILSHPSYVYCCTWLSKTLAVTGCYDKILRLWDLSKVPTLDTKKSTSASTVSLLYDVIAHQPAQCVVAHKARINSVVPLNSEEILISGDGDGVIILWKWSSSRQLEVSKQIALRELKGQVINKLSCHPGGKRILVATRDSKLRMIDLKSSSIIQWFHGNVNNKLQSGSCFCGCGSKVLACSEDGSVSVWEANTGERIATYKSLYLPDSPASLAFHPKDNMLAVVSHKTGSFPSLILSIFDRDTTATAGLALEYLDNRPEYAVSGSSVSDASLRSSRESIATRSAPRKKKRGILRSLLQSGVKTRNKKGFTNDGYADTELGDSGESELNCIERRRRAYDILGALDGDEEINHRLTDIIKRMDQLLTTSTPDYPRV